MLMDFIFGKKEEKNLNQRSQALNDLLLDELMKLYQQGPNPLPTYTAVTPDVTYSGPNTLLASLGMEGVSRPDLPTTEIGGRTVYSSEALQKAMEDKFAEENPDLYARLKRRAAQGTSPMSYGSYGGQYYGGAYPDPNEHYDGGGINPLRDSIRANRSPAEQQFIDDQLNLLHDGNHASFAAASLGQGISDYKDSGGIMGAISKGLSSVFGGDK